jgi:hypothetical protein
LLLFTTAISLPEPITRAIFGSGRKFIPTVITTGPQEDGVSIPASSSSPESDLVDKDPTDSVVRRTLFFLLENDHSL